MVKSHVSAMLILLLLTTWTAVARAQAPAAAKQADPLEAWLATVKDKVRRTRVVAVKPLKAGAFPAVIRMRRNEHLAMVGATQTDPASAALFFKVNDNRPDSAREAGDTLGADLVIEDYGSTWSVTQVATGRVAKVVIPGDSKEAKSGAADAASIRDFLAHDGYVLGSRPGYVLGRVARSFLTPGRQGVITAEGTTGTDGDKALALIELVESRDDFGIFRIILTRSKVAVPAGAWIQFARD